MAELFLVATLAAALLYLARRDPNRRREPTRTPAQRHRHHSLDDLRRRHAWSIAHYGPEHPETRSYHEAIRDRLANARRHAAYDARRWTYEAR